MILLKNNRGQALIEIVVALGIGILVLTAITATTIISLSNTSFSAKKSEAIKYLEEGVESVRIERDRASSWSAFLDSWSAKSWTETNVVGDGFNRTILLTLDGNDKVTVLVTVAWSDSKGEHKVESTTFLSLWSK